MLETAVKVNLSGKPPAQRNLSNSIVERKNVPVFSVALGDKELGLLSGPEFSGVDLEKVQQLLEDKAYSSRQLRPFHEAALKKVAKTYINGFLLRNCSTLGRILSICSRRLSDHPTLVQPMKELIQIFSIGLITQGTSHEAAYEKQAIYLVDEISQLVISSSDEIRQAACNCFLKLFSGKQYRETYQGTQRCSLLYNRFVIEQSGTANILINAIQNFELTDETELLVIKLLQKLTKQSGVICSKLLESEAAFLLVQRISQWPYDSEQVFRTVEIIWNLHDTALNSSSFTAKNSLEMFVSQLSSASSLQPLYSLFLYHLHRPHSAASRQLRNDSLVLTSLVVKYMPSAAFLETGWAQLVVKLATTDELGGRSILSVANNREDFELKKLLINFVALLSTDMHSVNLLSSNFVIPAFSVYVCAEAPPGKREWSEAQREEIQLHAIAALSEIVHLLPTDVIECRLPTRLLLMLDWSADQSMATAYEGAGNSFYGAGGYKSKRAQLRYCSRLLLACISESNSAGAAAIVETLAEQGAIDTILKVIQSIINQQSAAEKEGTGYLGSNEEGIAVEILSDLLTTLSLMCTTGTAESTSHNRELFGVEGCGLLCHLLRSTPSRLSSGLGHSRLLLAVLDCLWSSGIGNDITEDGLLENGCIFALLDLIQMMHEDLPSEANPADDDFKAWVKSLTTSGTSTMAIAEVALGALVDLLDNPKSLRHLLVWRGKSSSTAPHLLCEMWRRERAQMKIRIRTEGDDVALADSPESVLCSRIYSIFLRIGWNDVPGLTSADHITRPEIDHYLDDLTCFEWQSVSEELAAEKFQPTEEDIRMLQLITKIAKEKVSLVFAEQSDAIEASEQALLTDEAQFYEQISINQRLRQRSFERYADLVARTSRHSALEVAKQRQLLGVEASRATDPKSIPNFHPTGDIVNIGTTVYSGRLVAVDSEPVEITGGRLAQFNTAYMQQQPQSSQQQLGSQASLSVATGGQKSLGGSTMSMPVGSVNRLQQAKIFAGSNSDVSSVKKNDFPSVKQKELLAEGPQ